VLERCTTGAIAWHADPDLLDRHGILVAFSERTGGTSRGPWSSLDLAGHVGDDPGAVDANRELLLRALDLDLARLTCAEQVHGMRIADVGPAEAGAGNRAGTAPVPGADALVTALPDTPLMLCFADCAPVVLVATAPTRAIAVVHAGWRGVLGRLPGLAAAELAAKAGCDTSSLLAYVGPHICRECYEVGDDLAARFAESFGGSVVSQGRVDLGAAVSGSLRESGVSGERQVLLGLCTARMTDRFFSYRAEGTTGRHGALGALLSRA
jgi:hypothetical protein